jgi:cytochrome c2
VVLFVLFAGGAVVWILSPNAPLTAAAWTDPFHHSFHLTGKSDLPEAYAQADCLACHRNVYDIREAAPILYEGRKLFTTVGCIDCHRMDSIAEYEKRKVGPDLRHIDGKLSRGFVQAWLVDPKSFRPSTAMPRILKDDSADSRLQAAAITEYLFANSTPVTNAAAIPAGLTGHYEAGRLLFQGHGLDDAAAVEAGLQPGLKAGLGCLACHTNLNDWNSSQPTTRDITGLVGGRNGEPWIVVDLMNRQKVSRTDAEARYDAMSYNERQTYAMENMSADSPARIDGEPMFAHFGPELSAIGQALLEGRDEDSARAWLFAWLKNPHQYSDYTLMPNLRLSDQEALDLATYLLAQNRGKVDDDLRSQLQAITKKMPAGNAANTDALAALDTKPADAWSSAPPVQSSLSRPQLLDLGAKLISHYGCMNCHEIGGTAQLKQTALDLSDWGDKPLEKLDFSRLPAGQHTRQDWLVQHLTDPHVPALNESVDQPRMPIFHMSQHDAQAIATFVLGNKNSSVDATLRDKALNSQALAIAKGRAITELHNCIGCHQTEINRPTIQQYYQPAWISTYAPPQLRGEGNKVQYDWLRAFLVHVQPLRPMLRVRMPSFSFLTSPDHDEIEGIVAYFHAMSLKESDDLRQWLSDDDRDKLVAWALARGEVSPIDLDPKSSTPSDIEQTYEQLNFKAQFAAALYGDPEGAPPAMPKMTDSDAARGESMMQAMRCLDCHIFTPDAPTANVTGTTDAPGAFASNAKAPNLGLAWKRLQRGWVRAWVQEPDIVMHGTNMPPYFTGLPVFNLDGQTWQKAQNLGAAKSANAEQFGGTVDEQTKLLLDFLYFGGQKGLTVSP